MWLGKMVAMIVGVGLALSARILTSNVGARMDDQENTKKVVMLEVEMTGGEDELMTSIGDVKVEVYFRDVLVEHYVKAGLKDYLKDAYTWYTFFCECEVGEFYSNSFCDKYPSHLDPASADFVTRERDYIYEREVDMRHVWGSSCSSAYRCCYMTAPASSETYLIYRDLTSDISSVKLEINNEAVSLTQGRKVTTGNMEITLNEVFYNHLQIDEVVILVGKEGGMRSGLKTDFNKRAEYDKDKVGFYKYLAEEKTYLDTLPDSSLFRATEAGTPGTCYNLFEVMQLGHAGWSSIYFDVEMEKEKDGLVELPIYVIDFIEYEDVGSINILQLRSARQMFGDRIKTMIGGRLMTLYVAFPDIACVIIGREATEGRPKCSDEDFFFDVYIGDQIASINLSKNRFYMSLAREVKKIRSYGEPTRMIMSMDIVDVAIMEKADQCMPSIMVLNNTHPRVGIAVNQTMCRCRVSTVEKDYGTMELTTDIIGLDLEGRNLTVVCKKLECNTYVMDDQQWGIPGIGALIFIALLIFLFATPVMGLEIYVWALLVTHGTYMVKKGKEKNWTFVGIIGALSLILIVFPSYVYVVCLIGLAVLHKNL